MTRCRSLLAAAIVCTLAACGVERDPFPRLVETPAPEPAVTGASGVELLVFPDDDEQLLIERIDAARTRIYVKFYLLTDPRIFDALTNAERRGVDVRVLIEASPFGAANTASAAIDKLKRAGIDYKTANPVFRLTHEKSYVIDNTAVILTANATRSSFTRNREFGVVHALESDVDEIVRAFEADWRRDSFEPRSPNLGWSPNNARARIDSVITSARKTLIVYAASTSDDEQIALLGAARKRGVDVRVLTSPGRDDAGDRINEDLDNLQRAGVSVRYLSSPFVHAKVVAADGNLAFVGSINMTTQSLDFNRELGILIADSDALSRIGQVFEKDWAKAVER
jgi:phosphatidylserine/phosphatidylglycerophosphate/cardiolipin synthase-like enzyme